MITLTPINPMSLSNKVNLYSDYSVYGLKHNPLWELTRPDEGANDQYIALVHQNQQRYDELENKIDKAKFHLTQDDFNRKYYLDQLEILKLEKEKFRWFGYKGIEYPVIDKKPKYPYLMEQKDRLTDMFLRKYGRYRVGYNTVIEFQNQLQFMFESIADHYEARFKSFKLFNDLFEKEVSDEKYGLGSKMTSLGHSSSTGGAKQAALPDVEEPVPVYTGKSEQTSDGWNDSGAYDTSYLTKLNTISGYLTFDKYLVREYINEFIPLFQTLIW